MAQKQGFIYIMTNAKNTVLYTGVTNNLQKRVYEHKEKAVVGFTKKYNITKLVYYETFGNIIDAIQREKQIKSGSRKSKILLIQKENPHFRDLYNEI